MQAWIDPDENSKNGMDETTAGDMLRLDSMVMMVRSPAWSLHTCSAPCTCCSDRCTCTCC